MQDLVEEVLHLPLPDIPREVANIDRPAPAPAHPSPLQPKKGVSVRSYEQHGQKRTYMSPPASPQSKQSMVRLPNPNGTAKNLPIKPILVVSTEDSRRLGGKVVPEDDADSKGGRRLGFGFAAAQSFERGKEEAEEGEGFMTTDH